MGRAEAAIWRPRLGPFGGHRRIAAIEAHAGTILRTLGALHDITIGKLRGALAERRLRFGYGTLCRFLA